MDLPSGLLAAHSRLAIDERRIVSLIRLGQRHATGAYHCTSAWGEQLPTADGGVVGFVDRQFFGDVAYYRYAADIGSDPVVTELPPPGTHVWQCTPQGIWRTSRIHYYTGSVYPGPWSYSAVLVPAGPADTAGIPRANDSGSICWVRLGASWLVLGIVSTLRSCFVARPAVLPAGWNVTPVGIPPGADPSQPWPAATPEQLTAEWEQENPSTKDQAPSQPEAATTPALTPELAPAPVQPSPSSPPGPSCPLLIDVPLDAQDVMSPHAAQPDGQPDQIVDVALVDPSPVVSIVILGLNEKGQPNGDEWQHPDTGNYWHIRARSLPDDSLRLWMSRSRSCTRVRYKIQHLSGRESSGTVAVLPAPTTPTPPATPPSAPPPSYREAELADSLAAAQREITRLQAHIAELAALKPDAERWRALRKLMSED